MSLQFQYNFSSNYLEDDTIQNTVSNTDLNCILYNNPSIGQGSAPNNTNQSIYFNGSSKQYGLVAPFTIPSSSQSSGITFSTWFNATNQNSTWSRIFDFGNGAGADNIIVFINAGNIGLSVYNPDDGGAYQPYGLVNSVLNNTWYHITWTLSVQYGWNFYLNGTNVYADKSGWYPRNVSRANNYIAKSNWSSDPAYWGNICDFRYYDTVLTAAQVQGVYYGLTIFISTFAYQGCYNDEDSRAIPTYLQNVTTPEQCQQLAYDNDAQVFGVQYGGQCFIGSSLSSAQKYGVNNSNCGTLGGTWNNQVYYSGTEPNPPPPTPSLTSNNFSTEYFLDYNMNNKKKINNIFLIFICILLLFIFFIFITRF